MKIFLVALLIIAAVADDSYVVDTVTVGSMDVYYPQVSDSQTKFPGVIISPGANIDKSYYSRAATKIAENGYTVAVPTAVFFPFLGINVSTPQLINSTRVNLINAAASSTSPIFGLLETDNFHLLGHSLGGTMAIIAASRNAQTICNTPPLNLFCGGYTGNGSEYRSVAAFATTLISGPPPFIVANNAAAIALIYGTNDARISNASVATTYNLLLSAPKVFITVDGVNHLGITDTQDIPTQINVGPQSKPQGWSVTMISKGAIELFDTYGKNSTSAYDKLFVSKNIGTPFIDIVASQAN